jgi:hypothetical protein
VCLVAHPGDMAVGPNQHGGRSRYRAECGKLPYTTILRFDQLNPVRPCSDVEAAGLTEVEEDWAGFVQQGEESERAVDGDEVEVGDAAS